MFGDELFEGDEKGEKEGGAAVDWLKKVEFGLDRVEPWT